MANPGHPAAAEISTEALCISLGRAAEIIETLGQSRHGESTSLFQLAEADPQVLKKWLRSTSRDPLMIERRAFAKVCLSLVEAGQVLGIDRGTLGPRPAPPQIAQPAPPPPGPLAGHPVAVVRRRALVTRAASRATSEGWPAWVNLLGLWIKAFCAWTPCVALICAVCVVVTFACRPEWIVFLPAKLVNLAWTYITFAGSRVLARLDHEVGTFFGFTTYPTPALTGDDPNSAALAVYRPTHSQPMSTTLGWLCAILAVWRHN